MAHRCISLVFQHIYRFIQLLSFSLTEPNQISYILSVDECLSYNTSYSGLFELQSLLIFGNLLLTISRYHSERLWLEEKCLN